MASAGTHALRRLSYGTARWRAVVIPRSQTALFTRRARRDTDSWAISVQRHSVAPLGRGRNCLQPAVVSGYTLTILVEIKVSVSLFDHIFPHRIIAARKYQQPLIKLAYQ